MDEKMLFIFLAVLHYVGSIIVNTPSGAITGNEEVFNGEIVYTFYGIPYAQKPERFKKPVPVQPWTTTFDAGSPAKICIQDVPKELAPSLPNSEVTEDCLYVDIQVPKSLLQDNKKPVLVSIPGTSFRSAQTTVFFQKVLGLESDSIIVYISYRVDIFGFLSTGDNVIPGNFGLWDQKLAIEWVKSNILSFGGDPSSITLMGLKSGSIAVGFQAMHSQNNGNFQKIIMSSGFPNSHEAVIKDAANFAQKLAKLRCHNDELHPDLTSQEIYDCLVNKSPDQILETALSLNKGSILPWIGPVIDNDFIVDVNNQMIPVDVMVFVSPNEGFFEFLKMVPFIEEQYQIDTKSGVSKIVMCENIAVILVNRFFDGSTALRNFICEQYTNDDPVEQSNNAVRLLGDLFVYSPMLKMLSMHKSNKKYLSVFSKTGPFPGEEAGYTWFKGSGIGGEMFYMSVKELVSLFGISVPAEDITLGDKMIDFLKNFLRTGTPTVAGSSFSWLKYDNVNQRYLNTTLTGDFLMGDKLYKQRMDFWLNIVPSFLSLLQPNATDISDITNEKGISNGNTRVTQDSSTTTSGLNSAALITEPTNMAGKGKINWLFLVSLASVTKFSGIV